jgi:hypothetical protein
MTLTPAVPVVGDAYFFGSKDALPEKLKIDVGSVGTNTTITWKYSTASGYSTLTGVSDGTSNFTVSGLSDVTYDFPTDAGKQTEGGINAYYIKAEVTAIGGGPTGATGDQVWNDPDYEAVHEWGEDEWAIPMFQTVDGFNTQRNVNLTEGWYLADAGAGSVDYMTGDDGTTYTPPVSYFFKLDNLKTGSDVKIIRVSDKAVLDGTDNSGTSFTYNYTYGGGDVPIYYAVMHEDWLPTYYETATLSNDDQTIPLFWFPDRSMTNP